MQNCRFVSSILVAVRGTSYGNCAGELFGKRLFFNRNSITKRKYFSRKGRHALPRQQDSHEIQRIGRRDRSDLACRSHVAHGPQKFDGGGQSKLFSQETADKSAAANFAPVLETAEG